VLVRERLPRLSAIGRLSRRPGTCRIRQEFVRDCDVDACPTIERAATELPANADAGSVGSLELD
jgi:hypothetical protein